jgi:hypothetical protein
MFRNAVLAGAAALALMGCTQREVTGGGLGAAGGAIVGAATTGNVQGALVGGVIGAAAGTVIASVTDRPGYCTYSDGRGGTYVDRCP